MIVQTEYENVKVFFETFEEYDDLERTLSARPTQPHQTSNDYMRGPMALRKKFQGGYSTNTEAFEDLKYGLIPTKTRQRLEAVKEEIDINREYPEPQLLQLPNVGIPNLMRSMANSPTPFDAVIELEEPTQLIELGLDISVHAEIDTKVVRRFGELLTQVLMKLDAMGYILRLRILTGTYDHTTGHVHLLALTVKDYGGVFDLSKIHKFMCNTAFQRIISFTWRARNPYFFDTDMGLSIGRVREFSDQFRKGLYKSVLDMDVVLNMSRLISQYEDESDDYIIERIIQQITTELED